MSYYRVCENCGAYLDPGEHCDCENEKVCINAANIGTDNVKIVPKIFTSDYTAKASEGQTNRERTVRI